MKKLRHARTLTVALVAAFLPITAQASSAGRAEAPKQPSWALHGSYAPKIAPGDFVRLIDNPYFPLKPGAAFHFRGVRDGTPQTDDEVVTHRTKVVLGVHCTVVADTVSTRGKPIERTLDWYAQDKDGNVWYMGEDAFDLKNGKFVKASDSWQGGVGGAKPGIIMRGPPRAGDVYRQEYYPPDALDQGHVLGTVTSMKVAAGAFKRVLATIEWSPVEPQLEKKWYVAGVGEIREQVVAGGHEQFELLKVTR